MKYDLHIHSALSPCASDDMTPNNIVNMAVLNELDVISVTDHNSLAQQDVIAKLAKQQGLGYLYGVEIQTLEEVHLLAYFKEAKQAQRMNEYINYNRMFINNDPHYFGHQYLFNDKDSVMGEEKALLIQSISKSLEEVIDYIHELNGRAVLAHVKNRANSVMTILGFIPQGLAFDGLEVRQIEDITDVKECHPWLQDTLWLKNSDAHYLHEIKAKDDQSIEVDDVISQLWR